MSRDGFENGGVSRRQFVAGTASALALAVASRRAFAELPYVRREALTILFQGDSITDASRAKPSPTAANAAPNATANAPVTPPANSASALGYGYPFLAAAELLRAHPKSDLRIFNRGISGNRVPDLQARWDADTIALKPDVLSILIGVNDLWHKIMGRSNGTVDEYEQGYTALLKQTRTALPNVRLVVLEPFVLRTGAVTDAWFPEFDQRRAAAARVAKQAGATFIPLHGMFEKLTKQAPPAYWAADGVHPTPAGHAAIAKAWISAVHI